MKDNLLLRKPAIKWVNEYYEKEEFVLLKIFRKDLTESYDVLIDKSDFENVSKGQWYAYMSRKNTHLKNIIEILYTIHNKDKHKKKTYNIYQWILDTKDKNIIVDHKNRNRLDNRRFNIEISNAYNNRINQTYKGYNYDKATDKYLVRITCDKKAINIGRYNTELEAETTYLKAMILLEKDKISEYHKQRIKELNIKLTDEDYKNKYIKKIYILANNLDEPIENGQCNYNYDNNIDIIIDLVEQGFNWNEIARYLKKNIVGLEHAKGETVKSKYLKYINRI